MTMKNIKETMFFLVLSLASGVCICVGYFFLKYASINTSHTLFYYLISAIFILLCVFFVFFAYKKGAALSFVYPVSSLGQVLTLPLYHYLLNETLNAYHYTGIAIMITGSLIISYGKMVEPQE